MYNVSDAVEMGDAHEVILILVKEEFSGDDSEPRTEAAEEYFDE